jgi:tRNA dimethylallyltransferase
LVILGPTAVGKTKLSIELAKILNTEIINGDSVQVYQQLNIGSAKITQAEMEGIKHHLLDFLDPRTPFSVADYQELVRQKIDELTNRDKIPLLVGGTGLYIQAVLYDYQFLSEERDESFQKRFESLTNEALHDLLKAEDQESAMAIHPNNRRRVLRALEMALTHQSKTELLNKQHDETLYDALIIGLTLPRDILYDRINLRVDQMIENGLVDEVTALHEEGIHPHVIGYKEFTAYFTGEKPLETVIQEIKQNTRHYAKRQMTYFKNKLPVHWLTVQVDHFDETLKEACQLVENWLKN